MLTVTAEDVEKAKLLRKEKGPWNDSAAWIVTRNTHNSLFKCPWCSFTSKSQEEALIHVLAHLIHEMNCFSFYRTQAEKWLRRAEEVRKLI